VIREDDLVVGLVVHDAVETWADLDLLEHVQRLQIEHGHVLIAAVGREAVTGLGGKSGAVHPWGVRNVAQHLAGRAIDHHHVRATRNEDAAGGRFDCDVIGAAVPFDVELFYFEGLRVDARRAQADGGKQRKHGEHMSCHSGGFYSLVDDRQMTMPGSTAFWPS